MEETKKQITKQKKGWGINLSAQELIDEVKQIKPYPKSKVKFEQNG